MFLSLPYLLICIVFFAAVGMHGTRKNAALVFLYALQSTAVALLLAHGAVADHSAIILAVAVFAFVVKVILAPNFFERLINKHRITFSARSYLGLPLTAIVVALLVILPNTHLFAPLTAIAPAHTAEIAIALAAFFISCFFVVNRQGGISQMIGLLSIENSIVAFALFAGLEQSAMLQIGIMFDIALWVIIATLLASLVYEQFGTLDTGSMKHLTE